MSSFLINKSGVHVINLSTFTITTHFNFTSVYHVGKDNEKDKKWNSSNPPQEVICSSRWLIIIANILGCSILQLNKILFNNLEKILLVILHPLLHRDNVEILSRHINDRSWLGWNYTATFTSCKIVWVELVPFSFHKAALVALVFLHHYINSLASPLLALLCNDLFCLSLGTFEVSF